MQFTPVYTCIVIVIAGIELQWKRKETIKLAAPEMQKTASKNVFFFVCAFAQLAQPAQVVACAINTDGTKAVSQHKTQLVFWEAQISNYAILSQIWNWIIYASAPFKLASPLFGHCPNSDCTPLPPRTQTGTLGHFFLVRFEQLCQITVLRVYKCHKESWQALNPLLTKENT